MKNAIEKIKDALGGMLKVEMIMSVVLLCVISLIACRMPEIMEENHAGIKKEKTDKGVKKNGITIVIDPGHGGSDPGKIGVNQVPEKEINLQIALKLKEKLESAGYRTVMTRSSDSGLYAESDSNKKRADMNNRCRIINEEYEKDNRVINVSIHQNSYPSESVKGPQVFYYSKSEQGKQFAAILQNVMNEELEIERPRTEKANDNYYMLVHTDCPSVIVECGFLSNWEEAEKLNHEDYQEKVAAAIVKGIELYKRDKNL